MELSDFIDHQASGGALQSSGAFTIDFARAREKLIQFALPQPYHYLFKLVQFGNLAGCSRIEWVLKPSRVEAYFHGVDPEAAPLSEVHTQLLKPLSSGGGALAALLIGLNGALALKPKSLLLSDGMRRLSISEKGARLEETEDDEVIEISQGWSYSVVLHRAGSRKVVAEEKKALVEHCAYGEARLFLNGLPLEPVVPPLEQRGAAVYLPDEFVLGERRIAEAGGMRLPEWPEEAGDARDSRRKVFLRQLRGESQQDRFSYWIFLRYGRPELSRMMLVADGVLVDTIELNLDVPGLEAVLHVPRLKTDLTGLQAQRGPELDKMVAFVKQQGLELCADVLSHRSTLYATVPPAGHEDRSGAGKVGCLAGCPTIVVFYTLIANWLPRYWFNLAADVWFGLVLAVIGGFGVASFVKHLLLSSRKISYEDWKPLDLELRNQIATRLKGVLKKHGE